MVIGFLLVIEILRMSEKGSAHKTDSASLPISFNEGIILNLTIARR